MEYINLDCKRRVCDLALQFGSMLSPSIIGVVKRESHS